MRAQKREETAQQAPHSLRRAWLWLRQALPKWVVWGSPQFALYTWLHYWRQRRHFETVADPYRQIRVEPERIDTTNEVLDKQWGLGRIVGEEWERPQRSEAFATHPICRGLRQRFREGCAWEDTAYLQWAKSEFAQGRAVWGYQTLDEFRTVRCAYVDSLYERIQREGYRPNTEAGHTVPETGTLRRGQAFVHRLEPLVVIGRDGTVHWRDGFHHYRRVPKKK